MTFNEFMENCTSCGGNWTAMLISGIKKVAPKVYMQMPDRDFRFEEICFIVNHLCEDRPHFRYEINGNEIIEFTPRGEFNFYLAPEEMRELSIKEFYMKYNGMKEEDFE